MSKERARLDMAHKADELIIIALRKQAKELERAELARCAEECEKQSEYEGGLLDRIAELEKELTELKAYKAKLLAHVKYSSTQEEVEIIKLEQQAKGVNDFKKWVLDTDENTSGLDVRDISLIEFYVESLISQAKALKEQK